MLFIPYQELVHTLHTVLRKVGFSEDKAARLSELFASNSAEGSASHGVARFPRFIKNVQDGVVDISAEPERISALGGLEIWDGHFAAGPLIAEDAMARAIELAKTQGIACISVRNSNHWMRPGRYGWQAAEAGMIGICWSNTMPNMAAWGATDSRIGNNPIVFAIPRANGHIVVDMAMSQFSYGKMESSVLKGESLPCDGGFDAQGNLSRDPKEILATRRVLPMGYWKGSAMSVALDLIAAGISMGQSVCAISTQIGIERGLSQVFIAVNFRALVDETQVDALLNRAIDDYLSSTPENENTHIRYPGQSVAQTKEKSMRLGVPVDETIWKQILTHAD